MNLWAWIVSYSESIAAWATWTWQAPAFAALGIIAILAILRPRRVRMVLEHSEGHWLYRASAWHRAWGFCARWIMLGSAFVAIAATALYFGEPVEVRSQKRVERGAAVMSGVLDLSGSVDCEDYFPVIEYMDAFFAEKAAHDRSSPVPVLLGLYYFSDSPLFELFPTNDAALLRIAVDYGPACRMIGAIYGKSSRLNTAARNRLSTMKQIYGSANGTEPGPSMWQAFLDFVRYEKPELAPRVAALADRGALLPNAVPIAEFWKDASRNVDEESRREICAAMRGKRIVVFTDTIFDPHSRPIPFAKILELARFFCVPVDVVATGNDVQNESELIRLVQETGGHIDAIGKIPMATAAHRAFEASVRSAPPLVVQSESVVDPRPQQALLALAGVAALIAVLIRSLGVFIGW